MSEIKEVSPYIGDHKDGPKPNRRWVVACQMNGYDVSTNGTFIHKLVYEEVWGQIPQGFHIHHINGVKRDNWPVNLLAIPAIFHKILHESFPHMVNSTITRHELEEFYYEWLESDPRAILHNMVCCDEEGKNLFLTLRGNSRYKDYIILDRVT